MPPEKKPPNVSVPERIEADLTRDLRKVGGFFKGLLRFTEKAERVVAEAARESPVAGPFDPIDRGRLHDDEETPYDRSVREGWMKRSIVNPPPKPIARGRDGTEVLPNCEVCGDTREVGQGKKIPCPACAGATKR